MRILNFLSTIAPVLVCLAAPDDAAGGSSSPGSAPAVSQPPEPTGSTLEEKFTSAKGIISDFFKQLGGAMKERDDAQAALKTANSEKEKLQGLYDTAVGELGTARSEVTRLTTELGTANTSIGTKDQQIRNLESHCGVLGVDPKAAIAAPKQSAETAADKKPKTAAYKALREKEDKGEVARGSASKFYSKHKKEIEAESE
jgi:chromosome segregation ATPase